MTTRMTSREFNQNTGEAKRAAQAGPVYITDRGCTSHVLMTFEDYRRLASQRPSIIELLSQPPGVEDVEIDIPNLRDPAVPVQFD